MWETEMALHCVDSSLPEGGQWWLYLHLLVEKHTSHFKKRDENHREAEGVFLSEYEQASICMSEKLHSSQLVAC